MDRPDRYTRTSSMPFIFGETFNHWIPSGALGELQDYQIDESGMLYETDRVVTPVVMTELNKAMATMIDPSGDVTEWRRKAGVELLGVFRPYTTASGTQSVMPEIYGGDRKLAQLRTGARPYGNNYYQFRNFHDCPSGEYSYANHHVYMSRGPCAYEGLPPIVGATLNPFLHPTGQLTTGAITTLHEPAVATRFTLGSGTGHDLEYVCRDGAYPVNLSVIYPSANYSYQENWYRAYGVKAPLILVGWGYDVYGRPVPNKPGIDGNPTAYFEDDWLQKPQNWKAGPLDVRWDDNRGVWAAPPAYRLVRIKMVEHTLGYNRAINAEIVDGETPNAYDPAGSGIANKYIVVNNSIGYAGISGVQAYAIYNPWGTQVSAADNHAKYELIASPTLAFTIKTIGGGRDGYASGVVHNVTPAIPDMDQFQQVLVENACPVSGYYYPATYNGWSDTYQMLTFSPTTYPRIKEVATMTTSDTATLLTDAAPVVNVQNPFDIPAGLNVILEWNDNNYFVIVLVDAFNTPVTSVT
jgi:hypothetical protein